MAAAGRTDRIAPWRSGHTGHHASTASSGCAWPRARACRWSAPRSTSRSRGVFVRSLECQPVGTPLGLELSLAGRERTIQGQGEVVWTTPPSAPGEPARAPGMGIRFTGSPRPTGPPSTPGWRRGVGWCRPRPHPRRAGARASSRGRWRWPGWRRWPASRPTPRGRASSGRAPAAWWASTSAPPTPAWRWPETAGPRSSRRASATGPCPRWWPSTSRAGSWWATRPRPSSSSTRSTPSTASSGWSGGPSPARRCRPAATASTTPIVEGRGGGASVRFAGREFTLEQVAALVLTELRETATLALGETVERAVIAVPASYNDLQREAVRAAAALAGLEVERLVNEPIAAALAFGYGRELEGRMLVYDLGGGTFDAAVVQVSGRRLRDPLHRRRPLPGRRRLRRPAGGPAWPGPSPSATAPACRSTGRSGSGSTPPPRSSRSPSRSGSGPRCACPAWGCRRLAPRSTSSSSSAGGGSRSSPATWWPARSTSAARCWRRAGSAPPTCRRCSWWAARAACRWSGAGPASCSGATPPAASTPRRRWPSAPRCWPTRPGASTPRCCSTRSPRPSASGCRAARC